MNVEKGFTSDVMGNNSGKYYHENNMERQWEASISDMFSEDKQIDHIKIGEDNSSLEVDAVWAMPSALDLIGYMVMNKVNQSMMEYYRSGRNLDGKHVVMEVKWDEFNPDDVVNTGKVELRIEKDN